MTIYATNRIFQEVLIHIAQVVENLQVFVNFYLVYIVYKIVPVASVKGVNIRYEMRLISSIS